MGLEAGKGLGGTKGNEGTGWDCKKKTGWGLKQGRDWVRLKEMKGMDGTARKRLDGTRGREGTGWDWEGR